MALKNSKFSYLTRTLTSIPLAGKDALTAPEKTPANKPEEPPIAAAAAGEKATTGLAKKLEEWKNKFEKIKAYFRAHGERIGVISCAVIAVLLITAVVCSSLSVRHLNKGTQLARQGKFAPALAELDSAIWFNPNCVAALYERAQIYAAQGNLQGALADYSQTIKVNPFYKDVLQRRANCYKDNGQYRDAVSDYTAAIGLVDTPQSNLLANRGECYFKLGDYNAAVEDYSVAISRARRNASYYLGRSQTFVLLSRFKEAIKDCNSAAELEPRNETVYAKRSWSYHCLGRSALAMKDIDLSLEINPAAEKSYVYRGIYLLKDGHPDRALADFEQAIRLDPKDGKAYLGRGEAYSSLGDKQKAVADVERALKLGPFSLEEVDPFLTASLGAKLYTELGDYRNAIKKLTVAIDNNSQEAETYFRRASCYVHSGNFSAALKDCDAAIGLKRDNADYYILRAICQAKLGREVCAGHDFEKALNLAPKSSDAYLARGNFYWERKDFSRASDDFREASRMNPRSGQAKAKLAMALSNLRRGGSTAIQLPEPARGPVVAPDTDTGPLSSDLRTLLNSGYRELAQGRTHKAIVRLSRAVQLYPNDQGARRYLAYALLQGHEPLGALEQFRQLANLGGQTMADQLCMSQALTDAGRPKEALRVLKTCLEAQPENARIFAKLAHTYQGLGLTEKAKQACRDGIRLAKTPEEQQELESVLESIIAPGASQEANDNGSAPAKSLPPIHDIGG
jgi:tetratricopeptide (TPR) repeat protein